MKDDQERAVWVRFQTISARRRVVRKARRAGVNQGFDLVLRLESLVMTGACLSSRVERVVKRTTNWVKPSVPETRDNSGFLLQACAVVSFRLCIQPVCTELVKSPVTRAIWHRKLYSSGSRAVSLMSSTTTTSRIMMNATGRSTSHRRRLTSWGTWLEPPIFGPRGSYAPQIIDRNYT